MDCVVVCAIQFIVVHIPFLAWSVKKRESDTPNSSFEHFGFPVRHQMACLCKLVVESRTFYLVEGTSPNGETCCL